MEDENVVVRLFKQLEEDTDFRHTAEEVEGLMGPEEFTPGSDSCRGCPGCTFNAGIHSLVELIHDDVDPSELAEHLVADLEDTLNLVSVLGSVQQLIAALSQALVDQAYHYEFHGEDD